MAFAKAGQYGPEVQLAADGTILASRQIQVDIVGTSTPATLYVDALRTTTAANPVTTDANGNLSFFAEPGRVDIKLVTAGVPGDPLTVVVAPDPAEADADVASLQSQINAVVADVAAIDVSGIEADVAALQSSLASLTSSFNAHVATVVTHVREEDHAWALLGDGGTSTVFVPFAINEAAGETVKVSRVIYRCQSGTPTLKLQKNGVDLTGFTNLIASSIQATTDPADQDVTDKDELGLVCTAGSWTGWLYVSVLLTRSKTI